MKRCTNIILLTCLLSCMSASSVLASAQKGDLQIVIKGFSTNHGAVKVGLVSTKEAYDARRSVDKGFTGVTLSITENKIIYTFKDIPYGEYAIKYYHDENGNDHLDTNLLGIPKEAYGFSNNARALLGPPSFERAKFEFDADGMVHEMNCGES